MSWQLVARCGSERINPEYIGRCTGRQNVTPCLKPLQNEKTARNQARRNEGVRDLKGSSRISGPIALSHKLDPKPSSVILVGGQSGRLFDQLACRRRGLVSCRRALAVSRRRPSVRGPQFQVTLAKEGRLDSRHWPFLASNGDQPLGHTFRCAAWGVQPDGKAHRRPPPERAERHEFPDSSLRPEEFR